jgi:hypothetical protein
VRRGPRARWCSPSCKARFFLERRLRAAGASGAAGAGGPSSGAAPAPPAPGIPGPRATRRAGGDVRAVHVRELARVALTWLRDVPDPAEAMRGARANLERLLRLLGRVG